MKILMVNKFLYPSGGAETYTLKLGGILEAHRHQVQYFGLYSEKNTVGNEASAYVSSMDFSKGILKNLSAPFRIIYSFEARKKIRRVLDHFQPDVVHLNNIHFHLTPSLIDEIHKYRTNTQHPVRIIYTAHDYQLICPSHGLFDNDVKPCERCLGGNYLHCLSTRCVKKSWLKSALGTIDAYVWKWRKTYSYVDQFICCSHFLKAKLDSQERFRSRTIALHNFADAVSPVSVQKEGHVLEFGHLCRDKGTYTLLEAAKRMPETQFVFAGYGVAEEEIAKVKNARFVGFKTGRELETLIRKAAVSVYPSEWHENCPFSIIESQMYGTPVIGSRMGGIPELIDEGITGELFEAGNADDLEQKLKKILLTPGLAESYASNCLLKTFETPDSYYAKLMRIYGEQQ